MFRTHAVYHLSRIALLSLLLSLPAGARGPRDDRPPRPGRDLTEQQAERRDEVVRFIKENFPERAARLEELKRRNPGAFRQRRQELAREVGHLLSLKERDPETFRIQLEEMRLRDTLQRLAQDAKKLKVGSRERQEAEKALKDGVRASFELRHKVKEAELQDLRQRLQELESSLSRRTDRREALIEERTRELLDSGEEDW